MNISKLLLLINIWSTYQNYYSSTWFQKNNMKWQSVFFASKGRGLLHVRICIFLLLSMVSLFCCGRMQVWVDQLDSFIIPHPWDTIASEATPMHFIHFNMLSPSWKRTVPNVWKNFASNVQHCLSRNLVVDWIQLPSSTRSSRNISLVLHITHSSRSNMQYPSI